MNPSQTTTTGGAHPSAVSQQLTVQEYRAQLNDLIPPFVTLAEPERRRETFVPVAGQIDRDEERRQRGWDARHRDLMSGDAVASPHESKGYLETFVRSSASTLFRAYGYCK